MKKLNSVVKFRGCQLKVSGGSNHDVVRYDYNYMHDIQYFYTYSLVVSVP